MHEVCSFFTALPISSGILKIPGRPPEISKIKKGRYLNNTPFDY
jgi:hypothetical protein